MLEENFLSVLTEKIRGTVTRQARVLELDALFALTQLIHLPQYISNQLRGAGNKSKGNTDGEIFLTQNSGKVSLTPRRAVMRCCSV